MKTRKHIRSLWVFGIPYAAMLLWFWFLLPPDGAMLFSLVCFYAVLPILSFIAAACLGARTKRLWKWTAPLLFWAASGLMYVLTFALANDISNGRFLQLELSMLLSLLKLPHRLTAIAALAGVLLGTVTRSPAPQDFKSDQA